MFNIYMFPTSDVAVEPAETPAFLIRMAAEEDALSKLTFIDGGKLFDKPEGGE